MTVDSGMHIILLWYTIKSNSAEFVDCRFKINVTVFLITAAATISGTGESWT